MNNPAHPADKAALLNQAFKHGMLQDHPLRTTIQPICQALEDLHFGKMPWKVRFFALTTGRLPKSYLENSDD